MPQITDQTNQDDHVSNHRPSTFKEKSTDPGFLVAKGKFVSEHEKELQALLKKGVQTTDSRIFQIKDKIDSDRDFLEKRHVKNLASAIFMAVSNHGYASVRCIGRNSNYNASKAIAIATNYCKNRNIEVNVSIYFDEGNLGDLRSQGHVSNVTALVFDIRRIETEDKS